MSYYAYFLELSEGWYYVGISQHPQSRIQAHFDGLGSELTKKYPPKSVKGVWQLDVKTKLDAELFERTLTKFLRSQYGDKVRGAKWCREDKVPPVGKLRNWDKERIKEVEFSESL